MTDPESGLAALARGPPDPFAVEYHPSIGSTNDRARELAARGASDAVVLADEQTGGRGRRGRAWVGPPGGVYLSLVLDPALAPEDAPLLILAAGVAVARAARAAGVQAGIKWPNDVVVPVDDPPETGAVEGKLAGILTERTAGRTVVGIGVNANVDVAELPEGAVSLRSLVGDVDRGAFVADLLAEFDALRADPGGIVPAWRELAHTPGRRVRVDTPDGTLVGEAVGVEPTGNLIVETPGGRRSVAAGDCEHLRPV